MRTTMRAACATLAAGLAALAIGACGGDEGGGGGEEKDTGSAAGGAIKKGGTVKLAHSSFPDYLDPALSYTVDGWQVLHLVYPGLVTFKAESGPGGAEVVPALARGPPRGLRGRQDLHLPDARGRDLLERRPGARVGLQGLDRAPAGGGLAGRRSRLHQHRGRRGLPEDEEGRRRRDRGERRDGRDHHQARRVARRVPLRARHPVRGHRPGRHAGQEPDEEPPARRGPVPVRERQDQPRLHAREEQELRDRGAQGHARGGGQRGPLRGLHPRRGRVDQPGGPGPARLHGRQPRARPRGRRSSRSTRSASTSSRRRRRSTSS